MSEPNRPNEEELLERLLAADQARDRSDSSAGSGAEGPEEMPEDVPEELARVIERLDTAARFERRSIDRARRGPSAPGEDRVAATIERLAAEPRSVAPVAPDATAPNIIAGRRPAWFTLAAAAALVAFAVLLHLAANPRDTADPQLLGADELAIVQPTGPGSDFTRFSWRSRLPAARWFVIRVYPDDPDDPSPKELIVSPHVMDTSWLLPADVTSSWPSRIVWELTAFDASGGSIAWALAEASR